MRLALLVVLAALVLPASALASNDGWRTPDGLFFASDGTANTSAYSTDVDENTNPSPCPRLGKTAWWRITGTGQSITLSTAVPGTTVNTVLVVMRGTPASGTRIACNDDRAGGDSLHRSELAFDSVRGTSYLVQVGGVDSCSAPLVPCPLGGPIVLRASATRPLNDDRARPTALSTGVPVTTSNVGASQERGEDAACGGSPFAATVWYRWTAPGTGDATFGASAAFTNAVANRSDTVLAVYRADSGVRVGCDDDAGQPFGPSALTARVTAGDYLLQVGAHGVEGPSTTGEGAVEGRVDFAADADDDGFSTLTDCDDAAAGIHPSATEVAGNGIDEDCDGRDAPLDPIQAARVADRDGDGFPAGVDCRDDDRRIHPGATDTPRDGVDQDCRGGDARFPSLGARVFGAWTNFPRFTRFTGLGVNAVPARVTVKVSCDGRGCPFGTRSRKLRRKTRQLDLRGVLRGARLGRGARLTVRVTRPGYIGVVTTFAMRPPADPARSDRCLVPGRKRVARC